MLISLINTDRIDANSSENNIVRVVNNVVNSIYYQDDIDYSIFDIFNVFIITLMGNEGVITIDWFT